MNSQLFCNDDENIQISGELTFSTVSHLYTQALSIFNRHNRFIMDLSRVERIDSAGLAMLLACAKTLKQKNGTITFKNASVQLQDLAKLTGVQEILKI
jgi:phospholipid transport system transporter-binding protein